MQLQKAQTEQFVSHLPDQLDSDDLMYRIYLLQKIEAGEQDIRAGRVVSHEDIVARFSGRCSS